MTFKGTIGAGLLAPLIFATAAFAAPDDVAPLPAGTAAGVKQAQETYSDFPLYVGLGVVAAASIFAATSNGGGGTIGTVATGTSP